MEHVESQIPTGYDNSVWKRFSRIVVIGCEKYLDRLDNIKKELDRVGLTKYVSFSIDYEDPFVNTLNQVLPFSNSDSRRYFRCGYNHYRTLLKAYKEGCDSILMMEDDIVFPKDVDYLLRGVASLPMDYGLAMFDKHIGKKSCIEAYAGKQGWQSIVSRFFSTGMYAMNRLCIERYLAAYVRGRRGRLANNDTFFTESALGNDVKRYAVFPNLGIQIAYSTSMCRQMANYIVKLRKSGVDLEKYNMSLENLPLDIRNMAREGESMNDVCDRCIKEGMFL